MFSNKSDLNICFRWLTPFLWKGFNKNLKNEDLYRVLPEDDSKFLGEKLERYIYELYNVCSRNCFQKQNHIREWLKQFENKETGNPSLNKAIIRVFGLQYCLLGIVFAFEGLCLKILQPLCLSWLIR